MDLDALLSAINKELSNLPHLVSDLILENKDIAIEFNKTQIKRGVGSDNKTLLNYDRKYKGRYTAKTEKLSKGMKQAGELYTFRDTGAFLRSFDMTSNLRIFANEGGGDKKEFMQGYDNLYGLNKINQDEFNEIITKEGIKEIINKIY